jgi:pSer/pThr/pTyr-binding forkhead associated (FHA) protein
VRYRPSNGKVHRLCKGDFKGLRRNLYLILRKVLSEAMVFDSGYRVEVLEGADQGKKIPVRGKEITLGRKLIPNEKIANWILFNEPTVSRIHAMLEWSDTESTYIIAHKSKTNPTLVNTESIIKKPLSSGDTVQMGLLLFRFAGRWQGMPAGERDEKAEPPMFREKPRETGALSLIYQLAVSLGPDKGKTFPLGAELVMIRGREHDSQVTGSNEIFLNDRALPSEHLLLVWNVKENGYGIIKVETSPLSSVIIKSSGNSESELEIASDHHSILEVGDRLRMGLTELVFLKLTDSLPEKVPDQVVREPEQQESRKLKSISLQLPRKSDQTLDMERSKGLAHNGDKVSKKHDLRWAEQEKTDEIRGRSSPALKPDFQLTVLSGPDKGLCYSFLQADMQEERLITMGKRGFWAHAIELDEPGGEHVQAGLLFRHGKMSLVNEGGELPVFVNSRSLEPGQVQELSEGMLIQIGRILFCFSDMRHGGNLPTQKYCLMIIEGASRDRGTSFRLEKKKTTLGCSGECDLVLSDPDLSPLHMRIVQREGKVFLELLCSTGLSLVNGVSLVKSRERQILPGDLVRLSSLTLLRLATESQER